MAFQIPAYATVPLRAPYSTFTPDATGTLNFTGYVRQQAENPAIPQPNYCMAPIVATYRSQNHRDFCIAATTAGIEQDAVSAGRSVTSVLPYFPSGQGGVGAVVSHLSNATQWWRPGQNNAHAVGVLRQGNTLWIYDPQYRMGTATRLPMIPGTRSVGAMLGKPSFSSVSMIQVQGLGDTHAQCMGRTAEWIDNVVRAPGAVAPFPPGTFVPGQLTPGWQTVDKN
jgi:hypothetical protein